MRRWFVAALLAFATPAYAQVERGPQANTVVSRSGELIWYTGLLPLAGRRWGELDTICATVPAAGGTWRAPSMDELKTLMTEVHRDNGLTTWTELYLADESLMTPAIPPFPHGSRRTPQMNLVSRDLTQGDQPTTLDQVRRGRLYVIQWFNRWTHPFLSRRQSITHTPGDYVFGSSDRLLCVAETA